MLKGLAASEGIGIGKVMIIEDRILDYVPKAVTDTKAEIKRFHDTIDTFCEVAAKKMETLKITAGKKESDILKGHILILKDPYLISETEKHISNGKCAEDAFADMCDIFEAIFSSSEDELTRLRAADIRDIKFGMLSLLLGIKEVRISEAPKGTVLVAKELTPSMTAGIVKENIEGIITETGGLTSHSAILARALEIPAVLSVPNAVGTFKSGSPAIVDGKDGTVINCPDKTQIERYTRKQLEFLRNRKELDSFRGKDTLSASGEKYDLFCNIGKPRDINRAMYYDGEGIGLFRTEYLFMDADTLPSEEEQFEAYKQAAVMLNGKPLTIRTLDIGGDKEIPCLNLKKETNPFMGLRAIRHSLKNREFFKDQIRAILRASAFGNIKIMFPLITCTEEITEGKAVIEEVKAELRLNKIDFDENISLGIMIETPAAAVTADLLAKEADFFSIGTNDLTGYTISCDRENSAVSYLYSAFQPSVLRLIQYTIKCAKENHIPVGMCGEAAADPMMIPLLISFGITEFSVSAPSVLRVRRAVSKWTKKKSDEVTEKVMQLSTEREIKEYLNSMVSF